MIFFSITFVKISFESSYTYMLNFLFIHTYIGTYIIMYLKLNNEVLKENSLTLNNVRQVNKVVYTSK